MIGCNHCSLVDNHEWGDYSARFGPYRVDVPGDPTLTRRPTSAAGQGRHPLRGPVGVAQLGILVIWRHARRCHRSDAIANSGNSERTDEMFPAGSIENPLRYLLGPGPDEAACLALTPECMGLIPYLAVRFGIPS